MLEDENLSVDPEVRAAQLLQRAGDHKAAARLCKWIETKQAHLSSLADEVHDHNYFELIRHHILESPQSIRLLPLFALTLAIQARRIVEFGTSFTYYPEGYEGPWSVTKDTTEGFISPRIFLPACRLLTNLAIPSTLTSVELRNTPGFVEGCLGLVEELGLSQYWKPCFGMSSEVWLAAELDRLKRGQAQRIDLAYIDSHHTYEQVKLELEGVLPLMAPRSLIVVDNCYTVHYETGVDWAPSESPLGVERGGEYGAILEFLRAQSEWRAEWAAWPGDWMYLYRDTREGSFTQRGPSWFRRQLRMLSSTRGIF
jgi:hypothetical protein